MRCISLLLGPAELCFRLRNSAMVWQLAGCCVLTDGPNKWECSWLTMPEVAVRKRRHDGQVMVERMPHVRDVRAHNKEVGLVQLIFLTWLMDTSAIWMPISPPFGPYGLGKHVLKV